MDFWDCLRILILAEGLILGAMNVSVVLLHFKAWRKVRSIDQTAGLLPLHVLTIATSYGMLAYTVAAGVYATFGQGPNGRLVLYMVAFTLGIAALVIVGTRQQRRIKFNAPSTTVTIQEDTETTQKD